MKWKARFEWNEPGRPGWWVRWSDGSCRKVDADFAAGARVGSASWILWHEKGLKHGLPKLEAHPVTPGLVREVWPGGFAGSWRSRDNCYGANRKMILAGTGDGTDALPRMLGLS